MTPRAVISAALRKIGVIASGEAPTASEFQDSLAALNSMLKSWSGKNLALPFLPREVFPLQSGKGIYTMGPGGDFDTQKALLIHDSACGPVRSTPIFGEPPEPEEPVDPEDPPPEPPVIGHNYFVDIEYQLDQLTDSEWASLTQKGITSGLGSYVYLEKGGRLDRVHIWPVPDREIGLVLYSKKKLESVADEDVDEEMDLPGEYEEALQYNLTIRLASEFGRPISPEVAEIARDSFASLKSNNNRTVKMKSDYLQRRRFNLIQGDI